MNVCGAVSECRNLLMQILSKEKVGNKLRVLGDPTLDVDEIYNRSCDNV
jgi:hypothetical protein